MLHWEHIGFYPRVDSGPCFIVRFLPGAGTIRAVLWAGGADSRAVWAQAAAGSAAFHQKMQSGFSEVLPSWSPGRELGWNTACLPDGLGRGLCHQGGQRIPSLLSIKGSVSWIEASVHALLSESPLLSQWFWIPNSFSHRNSVIHDP